MLHRFCVAVFYRLAHRNVRFQRALLVPLPVCASHVIYISPLRVRRRRCCQRHHHRQRQKCADERVSFVSVSAFSFFPHTVILCHFMLFLRCNLWHLIAKTQSRHVNMLIYVFLCVIIVLSESISQLIPHSRRYTNGKQNLYGRKTTRNCKYYRA